MNTFKKTIAYVLVGLVVCICIIALLGIWDVIDLQKVMARSFSSLFVIFTSALVILFIIGILLKDKE